MRRLLGIVLLALALPALLVFGLAADDGVKGGYEVRALFDNVAAAVPGEDVKIAGAKVGVIGSMDVTKDKKAAVVLRIDDKRFTPFRADATCTVRPQSLIGEKFVECDPGTASQGQLARIDSGSGKGQHLLPLKNTSSPVDLDLINNINRRPFRERLSILLSEFGTGLAGRGKDLNAVIHRANPALRQTDRVLAKLARQNRTLARLASDSDEALAPLARERRRVSGFIVEANDTAQAAAERRADISGGIQRLPRFLSELKPLMTDLGGFAEQATPVARDLNTAAPDVSRLVRQLGPFSRAAQPSIETLGDAARTGRPAVLRTRPLIQDLGRFASDAKPLSTDLDKLTASFDKTGGIERLMDYLFFQVLAINGYDGIGHYLRAGLLVNLCSTYATVAADGCKSNYGFDAEASSAAARTKLAPALADVKDAKKDKETSSVPAQGGVVGGILGNTQTEEGRKAMERLRKQAKEGSPSRKGVKEPALDYLLGN
jgi:ABC-type transporter Mla subunit MlaD